MHFQCFTNSTLPHRFVTGKSMVSKPFKQSALCSNVATVTNVANRSSLYAAQTIKHTHTQRTATSTALALWENIRSREKNKQKTKPNVARSVYPVDRCRFAYTGLRVCVCGRR